MNTKEMRQALREAGHHVPRSNKETIEAYNKAFPAADKWSEEEVKVTEARNVESSKTNVVKLASSNVFTYIGAGDTPPHMIDFMGRQKFIRGMATPVEDPVVVKAISNHKCFVKGEVDKDVMFKSDEIERKKAEEQLKKDRILQAEIERAMA